MPAVRTDKASVRHSPLRTSPSAHKLKPSVENAKRVLARIAKLPPLLLPRTITTFSSPLPATAAPSKPTAPPPATVTPIKHESNPSPPSTQKRKRDSDSDPSSKEESEPAAKRPKAESVPSRLLTSSPAVNQATPPSTAARVKREETPAKPTPPSVEATPNGGDRSDLREIEASIKLLRAQITKTGKFGDKLYFDGDGLRSLSHSDPSYDAHDTPLIGLMQRTDAAIYYLTMVWFEDELFTIENEYERRTGHRYSSPSDDKTGERARREGTSRWTSICARLRKVKDDWTYYADERAGEAEYECASGAAAALDLLLASALSRTAEAHNRVAYRNTARWMNANSVRWAKQHEYNAALDAHGMDEHGTYRCVPHSIIASRTCSEMSAEALGRARGRLLVPGWLERVFPKVWRDCTRVRPEQGGEAKEREPETPLEEGEQRSPKMHPKPAFDPWGSEPTMSYSVPLEPTRPVPPTPGTPPSVEPHESELYFQWPLDLRSPVSHFAAFGRSVLYDLGRQAGLWRLEDTEVDVGEGKERSRVKVKAWTCLHGLNAALERKLRKAEVKAEVNGKEKAREAKVESR